MDEMERKKKTKIDSRLRNIALKLAARVYERFNAIYIELHRITCQWPAAGNKRHRDVHQTPIQQCRP